MLNGRRITKPINKILPPSPKIVVFIKFLFRTVDFYQGSTDFSKIWVGPHGILCNKLSKRWRLIL